MFSAKKRFIAGAVCPKCAAMDKLMAYQEDGKEYRECVACGFKDEMRFQQQPSEIETRVNKPEQPEVEEQTVQVLQFPPKDD